VCEGLRRPPKGHRTTQGLIDTPKSLISYRFQISETHVFISIDMVYCIIGGLCLPKFLRTNLFAFLCVCFRISVPTRRKQTDKVHSRCLHHTGRYIRRNSQHLACSDCLHLIVKPIKACTSCQVQQHEHACDPFKILHTFQCWK